MTPIYTHWLYPIYVNIDTPRNPSRGVIRSDKTILDKAAFRREVDAIRRQAKKQECNAAAEAGMTNPLELYPIASEKGVAIPLEVARLKSSFTLSHNQLKSASLEHGDILYLFATSLLRVVVTDEAAPDLLAATLENSIYIPAHSILIVEAQGVNIGQHDMLGSAGVLYVSVITAWKSLAPLRGLENV